MLAALDILKFWLCRFDFIYTDGKLCISILHPPVEDPTSGETAAERWNPTQSVESILISIVSLMGDPNCSSPANVVII
ncbi:12689_t:CDS:2 [Entrophospora sp. SA101]|nr:12689_t:CDS:2 [Entrophospora sp. SA101]